MLTHVSQSASRFGVLQMIDPSTGLGVIQMIDNTKSPPTITYVNEDGTPYTGPAPVPCCSTTTTVITERTRIGFQTLPFTAGVPITLIVPVGANLAELQVEGGSVRWTSAGSPPVDATFFGFRTPDGGFIELEGLDEITKFSLIGQIGQTGVIYVEYTKMAPYLLNV